MKGGAEWWFSLGNTSFAGHYLVTVTEEEAVKLLTTSHVHADRVRNAWKQANNFKSPNRKKQEGEEAAVIEPKTPVETVKVPVKTTKAPPRNTGKNKAKKK